MIDEVAEVKQYIDGHNLDNPDNHYRAVYMMAKFYRDMGFDRKTTFRKISEWVREYELTPPFSIMSAVVAGYNNENKLRCGTTVCISSEDILLISLHALNRTDKMVALALLCCAKAFADSKGVFVASVSALSSWTGLDRSNMLNRQIKRLEKAGYLKRFLSQSSMRGWKENYLRNKSRFKILVDYDMDGEYKLVDNDIRRLYEECFHEKAP